MFTRRLLTCLLPVLLAGCTRPSESEVVVYTALDSEFSRPIFDDFTQSTGISVRPAFDTESTKTVGLTERLIAERERPRADVFWNNEILNTVRLERLGLLATYRSPAAESYPAAYRATDGAWHGFAARARILIVNTKLVPEGKRPVSIEDLANPRWRGQCGMAKPLFGTTATHGACLFAAMGDEKARDLFNRMKQNDVQILAGNKQVALAVAAGQLAFGMTDTDDFMVELEKGMPVTAIYPDQEEGQLGTLFIPNTLCILKGGPNPEAARQLVDYLLSSDVESRLATGPSAQIPLNPQVETPARVETPRTVRAMEVDWNEAADAWDTARVFLAEQFTVE